MPIVHVTTWPTESTVKKEMIENLTKSIHETTGAPLDKITVYIQEVNPTDWGEAGVLGSDPSFKTTSRRLAYE